MYGLVVLLDKYLCKSSILETLTHKNIRQVVCKRTRLIKIFQTLALF